MSDLDGKTEGRPCLGAGQPERSSRERDPAQPSTPTNRSLGSLRVATALRVKDRAQVSKTHELQGFNPSIL